MRWRMPAAALALLSLSACGLPQGAAPQVHTVRADVPGQVALAVRAPGEFNGPRATPDLLVVAAGSLPTDAVGKVRALPGVRSALGLSVAQVSLGGSTLTVAAADPAGLRRYTSPALAGAEPVWSQVAAGGVLLSSSLREAVSAPDGQLPLGQSPQAPRARIAGFADLPPRIHAVVNQRWSAALGMPSGNAVLVDAEDAATAVERLRAELGEVGVIALDPAVMAGPQTAMLTGGSVAEAVGSFSYTPNEDGTVDVDPAWVAANIRTEEVPILGRVTCHRVMLPQLRGALTEIVSRGLADRIHPDEYAGCFYPRFIASDPSRGLSLHSWGIAFDINTPGNQRGTAGEIDRDVVAIFKSWGFAWGGDWSYTDPMHFELAALVSPR